MEFYFKKLINFACLKKKKILIFKFRKDFQVHLSIMHKRILNIETNIIFRNFRHNFFQLC